jgi:hypothetical protein
MELPLQPTSVTCSVTGAAFEPGDCVVSFLLRDPASGELRRLDCLEAAEQTAGLVGELLCRWKRLFKPAVRGSDHEREIKLTAESLFLSLADDADAGANGPMKQFLALLLERKRVIKARGRSPGGNLLYEHMRSKRMIEVPAGVMDDAFFISMRDKLGALVGEPRSARPICPPGPDTGGDAIPTN